MKKLLLACCLFATGVHAQSTDSVTIRKIYNEILSNSPSYEWLRYLTQQIGRG
jgi:carboxypeptidase Q